MFSRYERSGWGGVGGFIQDLELKVKFMGRYCFGIWQGNGEFRVLGFDKFISGVSVGEEEQRVEYGDLGLLFNSSYGDEKLVEEVEEEQFERQEGVKEVKGRMSFKKGGWLCQVLLRVLVKCKWRVVFGKIEVFGIMRRGVVFFFLEELRCVWDGQRGKGIGEKGLDKYLEEIYVKGERGGDGVKRSFVFLWVLVCYISFMDAGGVWYWFCGLGGFLWG